MDCSSVGHYIYDDFTEEVIPPKLNIQIVVMF